ncbi:TPA: restriction endonuclease subunit S [Vibrio parahaemolyticus]|nr:restriction endonuclease subunit S [Vibrio parahaemolyticus]HBC3871795.1 restriction endonuclease subunit S [Vibrio parahaemolyticus]
MTALSETKRYQAYPEYKDSGVEWLDVVPSHWNVSKVKHLAPFQVGWTPSTRNDENFIGENLWVNISDLKTRTIVDTAKRISDKAAKEASMDITPKGSLMYSFKLSVGAVSFAGKDMYTNEAIASFLATAKLPLNYLYYALPKFVIENASTNIYGAKILNQELINNALLLAPSFAEAERIANFLDHETAKIDILIEKQQQLIKLLKEKRQAVISHAVTKGLNPQAPMIDSGVEWLGEVPEHWEVTSIKYQCALIDGDRGSNYPNENDYVESGIPFFSSKNIVNYKLTKKNLNYISKSKFASLGRGKLVHGDLIITVRGTIGHVAAFDSTNVGCDTGFINAQMMIIRPKKSLTDFLLYLSESDVWSHQLNLYSYGSTVKQLSNEVVGNFKFVLPHPDEMVPLLTYLKNIDDKYGELIDKAQKQIRLMQERRTALISAAVTGKIDVRNWRSPTTQAMEHTA